MSKLQDAKLVLDWSNQRAKEVGHGHLNATKKSEADREHTLAKENYNDLCSDYVWKLKPENQLN